MSEKLISIKDMFSYFEKSYVQLFQKYEKKQNKLLSAIIYSYNILTIDDFNFLLKIFDVFLKTKNEDFDKLMLACILNFLSLKIIYTLPHLLNKRLQNNIPCVHILYGESITQLVSFCLLLESGNIMNIILRNPDNIHMFQHGNMSHVHEYILTSKNVTKNDIKKDYIIKLKSLSENIARYCLIYSKKNIDETIINQYINDNLAEYLSKLNFR